MGLLARSQRSSNSAGNRNFSMFNEHSGTRCVIRTHGGLGNQLFQVFYALTRPVTVVSVVHDTRYQHSFGFTPSLFRLVSESSNLLERCAMMTRAIVFLDRYCGLGPSWRLFGSWYLDGYFQERINYVDVAPNVLKTNLERIRGCFGIEKHHTRGRLNHIRLADFYDTDHARLVKARQDLTGIGEKEAVMSTNDELLLNDKECQKIIISRRLNLIKTSGWSAEKILKTMSDFTEIRSNNSTLAFWAALLSGAILHVEDETLCDTFDYLRSETSA